MSVFFCFFRLNELFAPPPYWAGLLHEKLTSHGYCEDSLRPLQGTFTDPQQSLVAMLHTCARSKEPFAVLARLWLMNQKIERDELEPLLGKQLIEFLCDWGLLVEHDGGFGGSVDIHPCVGGYFLTDRAIGLQRELQSVYHLGGDSYALAWLAPRLPFKKALDLATGSGVHAVLAARHCEEVQAVDISQRAIDFATFNAIFNGQIDKINFILGDIYDALPDGQYDLILSNLPWVPTPDEPMELYRSGGLDGEVLIRRMVKGLDGKLETGGWMASYIEYPKYADDTYLERVQRWLGDGSWGVVLMNLKHFTNAGYIMPHVASHSQQDLSKEFESWMTSYEEARIEGMGWAMLYVKKLVEGPSWSVEVESDFPLTPQPWVGSWLEELAEAQSTVPPDDWAPQIHSEAELWQGPSGWRVEWPERCLQAIDLSLAEGRLLQSLRESKAFSSEQRAALQGLRKQGLLEDPKNRTP